MRDYLKCFKTSKVSPLSEIREALQSSWKSPSNIALIKYWGKKGNQLPANPSLSMTLDKAATYTWVKASWLSHTSAPSENSKFSAGLSGQSGVNCVNNDHHHPFSVRLNKLYQTLTREVPLLDSLTVEVNTGNSFPHSTGIASSASGISAFVFCLFEIVAKIQGVRTDTEDFFRAVSFASRLGSGSACRSVYGGFTLWGKTAGVRGSSDLESVPLNDVIHPDLLSLRDAILVISTQPKSLSSSRGHDIMGSHPFAKARYQQARDNLSDMVKALQKGDMEGIALISENEALSLHALLMTSGSGGFLMKPATVAVIQKIQQARGKGLPVFFTLDAGPNIHLLYPSSDRRAVEAFIRDEVSPFCEKGEIIFDHCGRGAVPIHTSLF
jgi:diphosphomevalonate decarboxylase